LDRFIHQFTTLTELTEIASRIPDIHELLQLVLRKAMASTRARLGTIMLQREDGSGLEIVAAEGWVPGRDSPANLQETLCAKVIDEGTPMLANNVGRLNELSLSLESRLDSSPSFLIMPLTTKTATIGAVSLSEKTTGETFTGQDQQFLTVMLAQIGFAIENARLLKQARESAQQLKEAIAHKDRELRQAQTTKAKELAREINPPLASLSECTRRLLEMDDEQLQREVKNSLRTISEEAMRATEIVQNRLALACQTEP